MAKLGRPNGLLLSICRRSLFNSRTALATPSTYVEDQGSYTLWELPTRPSSWVADTGGSNCRAWDADAPCCRLKLPATPAPASLPGRICIRSGVCAARLPDAGARPQSSASGTLPLCIHIVPFCLAGSHLVRCVFRAAAVLAALLTSPACG